MNILTANDLKTRGISALEECFKTEAEAIISVHGKSRYVVIPITHFEYYRELELEKALQETLEAKAKGLYHTDIKKHIRDIKSFTKKHPSVL